MKKFLADLLKFLLGTIVLYVVLLFCWGSTMPSFLKPNLNYRIGSYGHMLTRMREVKQGKNVDVLFLGSSHAYRGFDTRIFAAHNISSFNLGSSSQTPIQTSLLLNRYLDYLNPKIVVFEVSPATFDNDGVESSMDIIANDRNDKYSVEMALKLNNVKTYNTLVYGFIQDLLNHPASYSEPLVRNEDTYIAGGYVARQSLPYAPAKIAPQNMPVNRQQLNAFLAITKQLQAKNIKILLVQTPVTKACYDSYTNKEQFDTLMASKASYYNFNTHPILNDSLHFYDEHHLNQDGVTLFNEAFINKTHLEQLLTQENKIPTK